MHLNFPDDHPLHLGYQWNAPEQNPLLADADMILMLGSDVPWIPGHNRPDPSTRIYVVDVDPLKTQIQLWHVPASRYAMADLGTAVRQIVGRLTERERLDPASVQARSERVRATHDAQRARWAAGTPGVRLPPLVEARSRGRRPRPARPDGQHHPGDQADEGGPARDRQIAFHLRS